MKIKRNDNSWLEIELEPGDNRQKIIDQYHHEPLGMGDRSVIFQPEKSTETLLVFWTDYPSCD